MKKILCLILSAGMLFTLAACGGKNSGLFSSFESVTLDGAEVNEDIFKGKEVTMVNIWATFCGPCIGEMPYLQQLHENYADKGFQVVGMVCDIYDERDVETARDIVKETGVKYVSILPCESLNKAKLNYVSSVPETLFVDETGAVIAGPYIGSRSYEQWAQIVEAVLEYKASGMVTTAES